MAKNKPTPRTASTSKEREWYATTGWKVFNDLLTELAASQLDVIWMVISSADANGTVVPAIKGWQLNRPVIGYTRQGEDCARTWQRYFVRELKHTPIMGVRSKTQAVAPPHVVISNNSNYLKETLNSFITHAADRIGA